MSEIDPSGVQVEQQDSPADVGIGHTNGSLALAGALADASPEIGDFVDQLGGQMQAHAQAKAQAAAFSLSGEDFAQAVREGKIEPTQNPWFMKAYHQDAAEVQATALMSSKVDESQTWAEKNDPAAYQARLSKEMGALAGGFTAQPEALLGFEKAATPIFQKAVDANTELNVQHINLQHRQDTTSLLEGAIKNTLATNPGADPQAVLGSLQPMLDQWKATGGTDSEGKELAFHAITGAAYGVGVTDPDAGHRILEIARQPFQGGPPLADIADATGKPYGEELAFAGYRIDMEARDAAMAGTAQHDRQVAAEGQKLETSLLSTYGLKAVQHLSPTELSSIAAAQGVSPEGALYAADKLNTKFEGLVGVNKAMVAFNETDPANIQKMIDYHTEAARGGLSQSLVKRLKVDVGTGNMTWEQANGVISEAAQTGRVQFSEGMATRREGMAEHHATEMEARQEVRDAKDHVKDLIDFTGDGVVAKTESFGDHTYTVGHTAGTNRTNMTARLKGAAGMVLAVNPDNITGAQAAVRAEAATIVNERIAARRKSGTRANAGSSLAQKAN